VAIRPKVVGVGSVAVETDLYVLRQSPGMSGKAKLVLVVALVAIVYLVVSSGGDSVEVPTE
jgi:hypothetical protein